MKNEKNLKAVAFGEVLWDIFEDEKKIGGAPLNVALRMKTLGCDVGMISCVGNDEDGYEIIKHIKNLGLDTDAIEVDDSYKTGLVNVSLNESGSASYSIMYPSAWDKIKLNYTALRMVSEADVLIYGSLVCRDEVSKGSLEQLLKMDVYKVFDVNLRKPHYTYEVLQQLMDTANFIKFNDEELLEIAKEMNSPFNTLEENMVFIAEKCKVNSMCVTKGKLGAVLMWEGNIYKNGGYTVKVADTVGAGDSFLATLISAMLRGELPQYSLDLACAIGALVAASPGANPILDEEAIHNVMVKDK